MSDKCKNTQRNGEYACFDLIFAAYPVRRLFLPSVSVAFPIKKEYCMILEILVGAGVGLLLGVLQFGLTSRLAQGKMNRAVAVIIKNVLYIGVFLLMVIWSVRALLACAIASLLLLFAGVLYRYKKGQVERPDGRK